MAPGWRSALSNTRSTSARAAAAPARPASGAAITARSVRPSSRRSAATMPRTHDVSDDAAPIFGNSTYTRSPVDATCASARKALALNAITLAGTAVPSPRNPTSAARPSAVTPSSRAIAPTSAASSPSPSRSCTSTVCVDGAAASRDMIRAASTAPPRSTSSTSSASGADPCCSQIVPAKPGGRRASVAGRWMPTASRGRRPNSGRSSTRTTSPLACSASKMPHWPIHSRCSGGPARPRMVSRRSSSASSLDAE